MKNDWKKEYIHMTIYIFESFDCIPETNTTVRQFIK